MVERLGYAEFELYGQGFAGAAEYETTIVDLGRPMTIGRVLMAASKWRREGDTLIDTPDADVALFYRVRTGADDDLRSYHTWNDYGELAEVSFADWEALKRAGLKKAPGYRGPVVEDRKNRNGWSGPIRAASRRIELPSRRYLKLELEFSTGRPTDAARLDSLWIELFPLLVPNLVGEVALAADPLSEDLAQVTPGERVALTYAIRANFADAVGDGFDAVRISTPAEPEFLGLRMADPAASSLVEIEPDVSVHLPG